MKSKNETKKNEKKMKMFARSKIAIFLEFYQFFSFFFSFFVALWPKLAETSQNEKKMKKNSRKIAIFERTKLSSLFVFFRFVFAFHLFFVYFFVSFRFVFAFHLFFVFLFRVFFVLASLRHKSTIVRSISQKLKQNRRTCVIHQQRGFRTSSLGRFPSGEAIAIELQHSFVFHDRFG